MLQNPIHIRAKLHVNVSETNAIRVFSKWAGHLYVVISKYGFEDTQKHRPHFRNGSIVRNLAYINKQVEAN